MHVASYRACFRLDMGHEKHASSEWIADQKCSRDYIEKEGLSVHDTTHAGPLKAVQLSSASSTKDHSGDRVAADVWDEPHGLGEPSVTTVLVGGPERQT